MDYVLDIGFETLRAYRGDAAVQVRLVAEQHLAIHPVHVREAHLT